MTPSSARYWFLSPNVLFHTTSEYQPSPTFPLMPLEIVTLEDDEEPISSRTRLKTEDNMTDDGLANDCKSSHYLWQGELKCHTKLTVSDITNLTQTKLHQQRFNKLTSAKLSFFLQV
jgi:hypothetical protein